MCRFSSFFEENSSAILRLKLLNPKRFYRANKQFIIAKKQIKSIIVWPDSRLLLEIGQPLPERIFISKNRSADFRCWITE